MSERLALTGARVFDGTRLHAGLAVVVEDGRIAALVPEAGVTGGTRLPGGILAPGFVDLQVNGGGGLMLGDISDLGGLARLCAAHLRAGTTGLLPTLITDTPETTAQILSLGAEAARAGLPGFLGLHLEGPHLDPRRKGAHDAALIRPMDDGDCEALCAAARDLPALMVTLAPCAATADRIARLAAAGVIVSLGHAEATLEQSRTAFDAGARCVTHLFNAMSPLSHRAPGLVGAALDDARVHAGLIADGIHVAPEVLHIACAAKRGADRLFLVTDAMAAAGTELTEFALAGRRILRRGGRLTLEDGTLAGADVTLPQAVARMVDDVGLPVAQALAMATSIPAACAGLAGRAGAIAPGRAADLVHLDDRLRLAGVWQAGRPVALA